MGLTGCGAGSSFIVVLRRINGSEIFHANSARGIGKMMDRMPAHSDKAIRRGMLT